MNWHQNTPIGPLNEIDYRALRLMMIRSSGSKIGKERTLKKFDEAWKAGLLHYVAEETALQKWMRCEARFTLGEYSDWAGWQYRDKWSEKIWFHNPFKVPVWDTKEVDHLCVLGEQGLGDEILFSQCIFDAKNKAKRITFETQGRLRSIMERSLGVETSQALIGADGIRRIQYFEADAWVSLGELSRLYRRTRDSFQRKAYIKPDQGRIEALRSIYAGRVGISWRGAQGCVDWKKLKAKYPEAISLQYDQAEEEVEKPVVDLRDDIEGVLALLQVLKKVVTVSTTVAHLSAASGVETDLIIADPDTGIRFNVLPWRWLDLSCKTVPRKSLWYGDNVKVYSNIGEYFAYTG